MPSIRVRLIDAEQHALVGATARVVSWSLAGRVKALAEGKTDGEGQLTLDFAYPAELSWLPRLGVQLRSGSSWRELSDSPIKVSRDLIEFGTLVVSEQPSMLLGTRKLYAMSEATLSQLAPSKLAYAPISKEAVPIALEGLGEPFELPQDKEGLEKALIDARAAQKLLDQQLLELDKERETLIGKSDALLEQLGAAQATLSETQTTLSETKAVLAEYEEAAPLVDVVQSVGGQLGSAAKALDQAALGMLLGSVSVSLKGVSSGPGRFEFPSVSRLGKVAGAEMSTIELEFTPIKPLPTSEELPPAGEGPTMPSVLGYTELLARRKLEALALQIEVSHKALAKPASGPSPWGRVVGQSPAPSSAIVPGDRVEILIGKPLLEDT